jgi:hypothetical protein
MCRDRRVRQKQSAHLVGRVVVDPVRPFRHVLDPHVAHPVCWGHGELRVEMGLAISPYHERRKIDPRWRDALARDVAKTRAVPVDRGVKRPLGTYPFE